MTTAHQSRERFEVDTAGMRQLHADRSPEQLIKELVQNAFDERAESCRVRILAREDGVLVTVEDDAPGFRDIRDAYTLMGDTPKRMDPEKRGRFNLGDKEVICLALWARVETTGWTIEFPPEGGRAARKNRKKSGTKVTALMPWGEEQARRLESRMPLIRPPEDTHYTVNGKRVERREPLAVHDAVLQTVLQSAPGEPIRPTRRKTGIHILSPAGDTGWLYEMGIPIQAIDLPYDLDVQQKVPMPPNRDTVSERYLQDLYAEALNAMHRGMREEEFTETWVRTAVESPRSTPGAVKDTITGRYGEKAVTWSSDREANMQAADEGYQVVHPRNMSHDELRNMREKGGLKSAGDLFGRPSTPDEILEQSPRVDITEDAVKQEFAVWVARLGKHAGKAVRPIFICDPRLKALATCTMNSARPTMTFNTAYLEDWFFEGRGQPQLELVIHELGHAETSGEVSHGPKWGDGCARIGAILAAAMAREGAAGEQKVAESPESPASPASPEPPQQSETKGKTA